MRRSPRLAALVLCGAAVVAALAAPAPAAAAAPIGGLIVVPGESVDLTAIRVRTSAGCPAQADAYYATMRGSGFPPDGQIVTANTSAGLSHSAGFDVYFAQTMKDFAVDNKATLQGRYDITVFCVDSFTLTSFGEFTGSLEFTTPTTYAAIGTAKPTGPPPSPAPIAAVEPTVAPNAAPAPTGEPSPDTAARPSAGSNGVDFTQFLLIVLVAVAAIFVGVAAVTRRRKSTSDGQ